jgi:hypothetical protein
MISPRRIACGRVLGAGYSGWRASRSKQRPGTYRVRSARAQHFVPGNRVAESGSKKHIRWEMGTGGYSRKADDSSKAIRQHGHPLVMLIPAGHDRGDRKNTGRMPGRKRTAFEGRYSTGKERIVKRSSGGDVARAFSSRNRLHRQIDNRAVGISFPREQRGIHLIAVMPDVACNQQRDGDTDNFCRRDWSSEHVVDIVEIPGVRLKVRHGVRIRHKKSCGSAGDGKSRQPMLSSPQLHREQPDSLLIVKEVLGQGSPRYLAVRSRIVAMPVERGSRRGVRQTCLVVLSEGRMRQAA